MKIIIDESKGLKVQLNSKDQREERIVTTTDAINTLLSGLMCMVVGQTTDENKEFLYSVLTTAFANCLGTYAPDLYFPTEEDDERFMKAIDTLCSDDEIDTELIEKAKATVREEMKKSFTPGSFYTDENGVQHFLSTDAKTYATKEEALANLEQDGIVGE